MEPDSSQPEVETKETEADIESKLEKMIPASVREKNIIEPIYYPVFFVAVLNLLFLFVAQPLAFWSDYSQNNVAFPFSYLVELHPLIYLATYIVYLIILAVFLVALPKVLARILAVFAFMYHVWALSSWTKVLLSKFAFSTGFYVVSYTSLGLLILIGFISFLLVHFAPKMRPFELVTLVRTKRTGLFLDIFIVLSVALIAFIFTYKSHVLEVYETIDYSTPLISQESRTYDGLAIFRPTNKNDEEILLYPQYQYSIGMFWVGEYNLPADAPTVKSEYDKWFREWKRNLAHTGQISILDNNGSIVATGDAYVGEGYCRECGFDKYNGQVFRSSFDDVLQQVPSGEYTAVLNLNGEDRFPNEIVSETFRVEKFGDPKIQITDFETGNLYKGAPTTSISWTTENIPERLYISAHLVSEKCEATECHKSVRGDHSYVNNDFVDLGTFSNSGKLEFKYDDLEKNFPLPSGKYKYILSYNNVPYNSEKALHRLNPDYFIHTSTNYFTLDSTELGENSRYLNIFEGKQVNEFMSVESVSDGGRYGYSVIFSGRLPVKGVLITELSEMETFGEIDYIIVSDEYADLIPSIYSSGLSPTKFCLGDTDKDVLDQLKSTNGEVSMVITEVRYREAYEKMVMCGASVTLGSLENKDNSEVTNKPVVIPEVGDVHGPFTVSEVQFAEQIDGWGLRHSIIYTGTRVLFEGTIYPDSDLKGFGYEGTFVPDSESLNRIPLYEEEYRKDNFFIKISSETTTLDFSSISQFEDGDEVVIYVDKVHLINDAKAVGDSLHIVDIQKK